jgi:RCR-type E3 ubiquitin transferase
MAPAFKDVCRSPVCIDLMSKTCDKVQECGHPCCGFKEEQKCLPCLDVACVEKDESKTNG